MTDAEYIEELLRRSPHITHADVVRLGEIAKRLTPPNPLPPGAYTGEIVSVDAEGVMTFAVCHDGHEHHVKSTIIKKPVMVPPMDGSVFLARVSNKGYQTHTQRFEHTHCTIEALVFDRMSVRYDLDKDVPLFKPFHDQPNVFTTRTVMFDDIKAICPVPIEMRERSMFIQYWEGDDASED